MIVFSMCRLVHQAIHVDAQVAKSLLSTRDQVLADVRRIAGEASDSLWVPATPQEIAHRIFVTCYMGTENSSAETRNRARDLAKAIGA